MRAGILMSLLFGKSRISINILEGIRAQAPADD
jgi:hypothetical protein